MSFREWFEWIPALFGANAKRAAPASTPSRRVRSTPSNEPLPSTDYHATLDELAGIGKNRRFDEAIDDADFEDVKVICRRLNPFPKGASDKWIETQLAKSSRAFYFGDRTLYEEEADRFDLDTKSEILCSQQFDRNSQAFDELKRVVTRGLAIPFVGAGMSAAAKLPSWTAYLLRLCKEAGLNQQAMSERLSKTGDYEGAINDIINILGITKFERDFERDFAIPEAIEGPVTLIPRLFNRCVITTNFDCLLEGAYTQEGFTFEGFATGVGNAGAFYRAIPSGKRYLMKLHGNVDNAVDRILLKNEYESAYGPERNIHFERPLPILLRRLFQSYSFLFLGCSLATDRTVLTFMKVAQELGGEQLPHHYALLSCPNDMEAKRAIDQRLADCHITPIWYPQGEHHYVEQILQLLLD